MDENQMLLDALGSETMDRMQYGGMITSMKCVFADLIGPANWLIEASNNWDALPVDKLEEVGQTFYNVAKRMDDAMENFYNLLQANAKYLFGEELPTRAFHASGCDCEIKDEE